MPLIQTFLVFGLYWTMGRALLSFALALFTGAGVYALSKFVMPLVLANFVFPAIPDWVGCMMKTVEFSDSISLIIAAYQARLTLIAIRFANRSIMG